MNAEQTLSEANGEPMSAVQAPSDAIGRRKVPPENAGPAPEGRWLEAS